MRLLIALTYYRPYASGLTIYVERLACSLARRGHAVTVLTSQHDRTLALTEDIGGVRVIRVPVLARLSKGVLMPALGRTASRLMRAHDALNLHLPQFDSPTLALRARLNGLPVILTYHCDVKLAPGPSNRIANAALNSANFIGGMLANSIVTYTQDYADHSPYLSRFQSKVRIIPPPVDMPEADDAEIRGFAERLKIGGPVIGMAARLAAEKGVEILIDALPEILKSHPDARVLFAGPHENVLGEGSYARRLAPRIVNLGDRWTFLGNLSQKELAAFYRHCSVVVVPSLNSTEAFGLVQVEAMLSGTPCVASALPGVRQPVLESGMGEIVPVGDSKALADAILRVIANRSRYVRPRFEIETRYSTCRTAMEYEKLVARLTGA